jgi:hypothetical protein
LFVVFYADQVKDHGTDGSCSTHREMRKLYVKERDRFRRRWEDNIEVELNEIRYE